MGKVPHRKRLTRRKDRDPRKRKKPPDTDSTEIHQQNADSFLVQGTEQISTAPCDSVSNSSHSSNPLGVVSDPVPLTPLVEKLKQHLRRIRYENSSKPENNTLFIP